MSSSEGEPEDDEALEEEPAEKELATFESLGLAAPLCDACHQMGFKAPTPIQCEAIPWALQGRDIIGLAETGSGKTAAFGLPVLHMLLERPQPLFGLVISPTRELALQISEQFEALGAIIGVKCAAVVGGVDMMAQSILLAKRPHLVVGTPGRLVDHLQNTKGFSVRPCAQTRIPVGMFLFMRRAFARVRTRSPRHRPHTRTQKRGASQAQLRGPGHSPLSAATVRAARLRSPSQVRLPSVPPNYPHRCAPSSTWCSTRRTSCSTWTSRRSSTPSCRRARANATPSSSQPQ